MGFKEQVEHGAAVAKWKVDQQLRISKIQGQINEVENIAKGKKISLGEIACGLAEQGYLLPPELIQISQEIVKLKGQIVEFQRQLHVVKSETGPVLLQSAATFSGLVCPICGTQLPGKYCTVHGIEGVKSVSAKEPAPATMDDQAGYLVCPVCQKSLRGKFCPDHGVAGIPSATSKVLAQDMHQNIVKDPSQMPETQIDEDVANKSDTDQA